MDKITVEKVKKAKAPLWKKALTWSGAILGILTLIGIAIMMAVHKSGPISAVSTIIKKARNASSKADIEAKIEKAKSLAVEKTILDKLETIKGIADEEERAKRLADMF